MPLFDRLRAIPRGLRVLLLVVATVLFGLASAALQSPGWAPSSGWKLLWALAMGAAMLVQLLALLTLLPPRR